MSRTILAGTLAGILTGATYLSTPSTAKEPPIRPSPVVSAYGLEDIAKLQEKMRDVCRNGVIYQQEAPGTRMYYPSTYEWSEESELSKATAEKQLRIAEKTLLWPNLLNKGLISLVIPIELSPKDSPTFPWRTYFPKDYRVWEAMYERPDIETPCPPEWLSGILIISYERQISKCQEFATGLETAVRVIGNTTYIFNAKTSVAIKNDPADKIQSVSRAILETPSSSKWTTKKHDLKKLLTALGEEKSADEVVFYIVDDIGVLVCKL